MGDQIPLTRSTIRWYVRSLPRATRTETLVILGVAAAVLLGSLLFDAAFGSILPGDPRQLRAWFQSTGSLAPSLFIGALALAIVIPPIPSIPLDLAAGLTFGLFWGTVYTLLGAELGGLIAFLLARHLGRPWLVRHVSRRAMRSIDATAEQRLGSVGFGLMRLFPVFDFDLVSYAAGLTPLPTKNYAVATLVGMLLPVAGIVAVGNELFTNSVVAAAIFGGLLLLYIAPPIGWLLWPEGGAGEQHRPHPHAGDCSAN